MFGILGTGHACNVICNNIKGRKGLGTRVNDNNYYDLQVRVPGLQARCGHRAAAFPIAPALTLVTIFGGDTSSGLFSSYCANTTVLELGESTCIIKLAV